MWSLFERVIFRFNHVCRLKLMIMMVMVDLGWGCGWRCSQVDASELILGNSIKLHSAQYHTVHNITQCTISHSAQYHTVHRPPHSIEQRPVWHLCYWLWAGGMQAMTHHSTHTYCNTPHTQNERRDTHYWYTLYLTIWHTRHRVIKSWPSGCISLQEGTVQTMFESVWNLCGFLQIWCALQVWKFRQNQMSGWNSCKDVHFYISPSWTITAVRAMPRCNVVFISTTPSLSGSKCDALSSQVPQPLLLVGEPDYALSQCIAVGSLMRGNALQWTDWAGWRWQTTREVGGCASYIHQSAPCRVQLHNCANCALWRYCEQGRGANCVGGAVPALQLRHLPWSPPPATLLHPTTPASPVLSPCPLEGGLSLGLADTQHLDQTLAKSPLELVQLHAKVVKMRNVLSE